MSDIDLGRLMHTPIYAFDFQIMIGDVQEYLDFSERTIESQYRTELQSIRRHAEGGDFPPEYREHLEINAEHRFKVSLPLRIRYGALLALTTAVEWSVEYLSLNAAKAVGKGGKTDNETVFRLKVLTKRAGLERGESISHFEALAHVRNCIAHNAGLKKGYKYAAELPDSISRLKGFSLAQGHFLGSHVVIERGALDTYIEDMKHLVVDLHKNADEQGLLKSDT